MRTALDRLHAARRAAGMPDLDDDEGLALGVRLSREDDGYIADIPDLDACSAFGASPQAALEEVLQAKEAWLAAACERGIAIPPPRYRPALYA